MNITPIEAGIGALSGGMIALLCLLFLIPLVASVILWKKSGSDFRIPAIISMIVIGIAGTIGAGAVMVEKETEKRANEVRSYVTGLGFEIKDGDIAVTPGTDKAFTVSKDGRDFECTSYAPDSINDKIFLVCDTAITIGKGSIEDLSIQLKGMKIRDEEAAEAKASQVSEEISMTTPDGTP